MKNITKNNLEDFVNYYHYFHDSYITNINYDITNSKIELFMDVTWSGEPILKDNNTYETNKTKLQIVFSDILEYTNKEIFSYEYIDKIFIKYINIDNKEYICFATDDKEPLLYIICSNIEYNEIK